MEQAKHGTSIYYLVGTKEKKEHKIPGEGSSWEVGKPRS